MWRKLSAFGFLLVLFSAALQAASWKSDRATSELGFVTRFEGAEAAGKFIDFHVSLDPGPLSPAGGRLQVTVQVGSADMGSEDLNEAIRDDAWFSITRFPTAEFQSRVIRDTGQGRFEAEGFVTIKGIRQPVRVPFEWITSGNQARLAGEVVLNRLDFNIGAGEWADPDTIGHAVTVQFAIDLVSSP